MAWQQTRFQGYHGALASPIFSPICAFLLLFGIAPLQMQHAKRMYYLGWSTVAKRSTGSVSSWHNDIEVGQPQFPLSVVTCLFLILVRSFGSWVFQDPRRNPPDPELCGAFWSFEAQFTNSVILRGAVYQQCNPGRRELQSTFAMAKHSRLIACLATRKWSVSRDTENADISAWLVLVATFYLAGCVAHR